MHDAPKLSAAGTINLLKQLKIKIKHVLNGARCVLKELEQ
jgi:hypothetical protein